MVLKIKKEIKMTYNLKTLIMLITRITMGTRITRVLDLYFVTCAILAANSYRECNYFSPQGIFHLHNVKSNIFFYSVKILVSLINFLNIAFSQLNYLIFELFLLVTFLLNLFPLYNPLAIYYWIILSDTNFTFYITFIKYNKL